MARSTRATAATATPTVIYVHGIGRQPAAAQVKLDWDRRCSDATWPIAPEWRTGPMCARPPRRVRGPRVHEPVSAAGARREPKPSRWPIPRTIRKRSSRRRTAATPSATLRRSWELRRSPTPEGPGTRVHAASFAARIGARAAHGESPGGRRPSQGPAGAEWVRRRVTTAITRLFIRDSAAYFFDAARRQRIQERVRGELEAATGPVVLVSHSQGSIVAFDVLSALRRASTSRCGSPSARRSASAKSRSPRSARHAPYRYLAELCRPARSRRARQATCRRLFGRRRPVHSTAVVNAASGSLIGFNPHSATGYLSTAPGPTGGLGRDRDCLRSARLRWLLPARRAARDARRRAAPRARRVARPGSLGRDSEFDHLTSTTRSDGGGSRRAGSGGGCLPRSGDAPAHRDSVVNAIESIIGERYGKRANAEVARAQIDPLRRFVAARLTTVEMQALRSGTVSTSTASGRTRRSAS